MAVNSARSMNADLQQGLLDGAVKSLTPDRGGAVERHEVEQRANDLQPQYNITDNKHVYNCACGSCGLGYS